MSLTSPTSKMSKSDKDPNGCVYLLEKPEDIMRKFKKAVTDSEACVRYDPANKPVVTWRAHANLLYSNWINYYIYQVTPYNIDEIY